VRTLPALRQQVSELIASNIVNDKETKVVLVARRALGARGKTAETKPGAETAETVMLQVPREPLGIRAIEVEAALPAPLNPPISPRGFLVMAWDQLRNLQNAGGDLGQDVFLRNVEGDGLWLGWQKRTAQPVAEDALSGAVAVYHIVIDGDQAGVARSENVSYRLRIGDYNTMPPFVLESVEVTNNPGDGRVITTVGRRTGAVLRSETEITTIARIEGPIKMQRECPPGSIVPSAVGLVAAAMPQQKDAVIPLHLMSVRDLVARPGYVLASRGKQALPGTGTELVGQAWRVDLFHCGVIIESYWFSDQRRLLRIDSLSGTPIVSRRVPTEQEAKSSVEERVSPHTTTAPR
jgi:hypothetical protein